jgi:hypothetical protein
MPVVTKLLMQSGYNFKNETKQMKKENNYIEINRQSWNNRVETHLKSKFYDLDNFIKGKTSLNSIELDLLGDVKGKTIIASAMSFWTGYNFFIPTRS